MDESSTDYVKIMNYIDNNPAAVLSTVSGEGPHGAVVYVVVASHGTLCFVTKNQTKKYANILERPEVSLTFFNEQEGTTLQVSGKAFVAEDSGLKEYVFNKMQQKHALMADWLPPVTKIENGEYAVIGITLGSARLAEYQHSDASGPTFTDI